MRRFAQLTSPLKGGLGVVLFSFGTLLGLGLFGAMVWADFEAALFNPGVKREAPLRSLRCPVMITTAETGTVSASITNPLDRSTERYARAHISEGYVTLMREEDRHVSLAAGKTEQLRWTVTADDAAFERLILVRALVRGRYPLPSRQGTCGIIVIDVPGLGGGVVFGALLASSLLVMAAGYLLWLRAGGPRGGRMSLAAAMRVLAGCVLLGIVVGWIGWWVPGAVILLITLLGIGVIIGHYLNRV